MDHQEYMRDGQSKLMPPQKNAYARLVQQHHSPRFKNFLNHIAEIMHLDEGSVEDPGLESGYALRGSMKEDLERSELYAPGFSPKKAAQPEKPAFLGAEKRKEHSDVIRKIPALSNNHQQKRRDLGINQAGNFDLEEESVMSKKHGLIIVADASGGRVVFNCTKKESDFQKPFGSSERNEQECMKFKQKKKNVGVCNLEKDEFLSGKFTKDHFLPNSLNLSYLLSDQIQGGNKRGFARMRNNSESARPPPSYERKRQLSESQLETWTNSDYGVNARHLEAPRGVTHAASSPASDKKKNRRKCSRGRKRTVFETYMSKSDVSEGLKRGELIQGAVRINPKKFHEAFIRSPDGTRDIFIDGVVSRNRALNGDVVVVKLLPKEQWKVVKMADSDRGPEGGQHPAVPQEPPESVLGDVGDPDVIIEAQFDDSGVEGGQGSLPALLLDNVKKLSIGVGENANNICSESAQISNGKNILNARDAKRLPETFLQRTAKVVYILEKKHSRAATGFIKPLTDKNSELSKRCAMFSPVDHRLPRVYVPLMDCPDDFVARPDVYLNIIFICRIVEWKEDSNLQQDIWPKALARLFLCSKLVMLELKNISRPYCERSKTHQASILLPTVAQRRSLIPEQKECIFTIDPATARDLDDALSCKLLPDVPGREVFEVEIVYILFQTEGLLWKTIMGHSSWLTRAQRAH
ncbi:DIS3-like exonuclease 2 [Microcaecilia unicolor]|uniref:DIS3-like exonuclease 2 n=1 Tax=Microcaecilia unicolor TaxID=1415580 RepID=A0A6P7X2L5_9AMPH|nr:DIS3-like exonuclease 2 [Microcaecilia unicolor]